MAGRGGSSSDDQDTLATIVKDVHAKLRKELKAGTYCPLQVFQWYI